MTFRQVSESCMRILRKYCEEFQLGNIVRTQALTVTETHLVMSTSLTGDWYLLQTDVEYAKG